MTPQPKAPTHLTDLVFLGKLLRPRRGKFYASVVALAISHLLGVVLAVLSIQLSVAVITQSTDANSATPVIFAIMAAVVITAIATLVESWWSHELAYGVLSDVRSKVFGAIERIAPFGLARRRTADVAARTMGDVEQLEWFYAHTVGTAIVAGLTPVLATGYLVTLLGPAAGLLLVAVLAMVAAPLLLLNVQRRQGRHRRQSAAEHAVVTSDGVQGLRELILLGAVAQQRDRILRTSTTAHRAHRAVVLRSAAESALAELVLSATIITALLAGAAAISSGTLARQELPTMIVAITAALVPVLALVAMLSRSGEIGACAQRVREVITAPNPISEAPVATTEPEPAAAALTLDQVTFGYSGSNSAVLRNVSVMFPRGKTIAVVGPSGVGKSTLSALLLRFADPQSGALRYRGVDLRAQQPEQHRERVALLPQVGHIFIGTVRENLLLAKPDATDADLQQAINQAGLADTLANYAGLDTHVGDGQRSLSGGERQRLCIARAILRDAEILVLDEPLANVDPALERTITKTLAHNRDGKTTIFITHRLAHICTADTIMVLSADSAPVLGTHEELLASNQYYQTTWATQQSTSL